MAQALAALLRTTIARELPELLKLTDEAASIKLSGADSWSPKQELGHLIDSASNNHVRFVNASLHDSFTGPGYPQNGWVDLHGYQEKTWSSIVFFWHAYNAFLTDLLERIPEEKLNTICAIGTDEPASLAFVIEDYVLHMQHHIDHLLQRAAVTRYHTQAKP